MRLEGRRGCACSAKVDSGLRSEHAQIKDSWPLILRGSLRSHLQRQRQSRCAGMTDLRYASAFPRRDGPEFYKTASPLLRIEGVGNAGCPMHPQPRVRYMRWHTSVVTTGPPDSPHRRCRISGWSNPVRPDFASDNLAPATGVRTTRLGRPLKRRSSCTLARSLTRFISPCDCHSRLTLSRPPHPMPNVRDDRETPLCGPGRRGICI